MWSPLSRRVRVWLALAVAFRWLAAWLNCFDGELRAGGVTGRAARALRKADTGPIEVDSTWHTVSELGGVSRCRPARSGSWAER